MNDGIMFEGDIKNLIINGFGKKFKKERLKY